ncbi:hypothetical protein L210DRAFT_3507609 [Boletus edulis BED1]|uniref:Uncharacterized protein n=1 Tax=Boletus edulis BED1 TaxID=1328754 RepID=A0AAD4BIT6_BOLED|nr:hypothetical protein L210DRAFT_3507609 [Boletus edulis BED1]
MSMYTFTQMKSLKKELAKFIIDEAQSLNKNKQEYVQLMKSTIAYVSDGMQDIEPSEFVFPTTPQGVQVVPWWLQGWKDGQKEKEHEQVYDPIANQRMSGRGSIEPQGGQDSKWTNRKRPARTNVNDAPSPKWPRSTNNAIIILNFHVDYLVDLLKDNKALANRVIILQQALQMVNMEANPRLVQWHLKDIKKLLPQEDVLEAVDLLAEYPSILLAAAWIHVVLEIIPQIIQPKEVWQVWMQDNLAHEVFQKGLKQPSEGHSQPRLLGSLHSMLPQHYRSGTTLDTLCFDEVHADDPLVTSSGYLDVHTALPKLEGDDFWKKAVILKSQPLEHAGSPRTKIYGQDHCILFAPKLTETLLEECSQEATHASDGQNDNMPMHKREVPKGEGERKCPRKMMKMEVMINSLESRNRGKAQAGPSTSAGVKGKAKEDVPVTPKGQDTSEDCGACRSRGLRCTWPTAESSTSWNEKCVCHRDQVKLNHPVQGKRWPMESEQVNDNVGELYCQLSDRLMVLERNQRANGEEHCKLITRIAKLELQVSRLKRNGQ